MKLCFGDNAPQIVKGLISEGVSEAVGIARDSSNGRTKRSCRSHQTGLHLSIQRRDVCKKVPAIGHRRALVRYASVLYTVIALCTINYQ